jgi:hypothetical protein
MDFWSELWSFLTAVGTISMAVTTYAVIRQSREQLHQGQKQHRDRFKPICFLMPWNGVDPWNKRNQLMFKNDPDPASDNPSFGSLGINCVLRNVGTAPALNLRVKFRFPNWTTEPWELSPLGAGDSRPSPLVVPVRIQDRINRSDFSMVTGESWEIWLEYEDVFGERFCTVHHKGPLQCDNQSRGPGSLSPNRKYPEPSPVIAEAGNETHSGQTGPRGDNISKHSNSTV